MQPELRIHVLLTINKIISNVKGSKHKDGYVLEND